MIAAFWANLKFELNIRRKSISTYVYFLMFFALACLMGVAAGGGFQGVVVSFGFSNKVHINSGVSILGFLGLLSAFSLFITAPAFGQAVVKDYAQQFDQIIYSTPIGRRIFLTSRFLAAMVFMLLVLTSMGLGIFASTYIPAVQEAMVGPNLWVNYVWPYVLIVIPNMFVFGSFFFLVATRSKKMAPVYILTILFVMGWLMSGQVLSEVENKMMGSLLDPFGLNALQQSIKYWSADAQNTQRLGFESYMLANRTLWMSLGLIAFVLSLFTFRWPARASKVKASTPARLAPPAVREIPKLSTARTFSKWAVFARQFRLEYKQIFKSIYFQALLLAGVCYMFIASQTIGQMFGTNTYPVTYKVLDMVGGSFDLFLVIISTIFAGEVVWRDRDSKMQQVVDATPAASVSLLAAKWLTLVAIVATLLFTVIICGVIIQAFHGYTNFEIGLYLRHLYGLRILAFINIISLLFFFQVVTGDKYVAHGLAIGYYLINGWAGTLGFEHKLYLYNAVPGVTYSDMNGYSNGLATHLAFRFYWMSLAALLMTISVAFWQRGNLTSFKDRRSEARRRFTGGLRFASAVFAILFVTGASFLFYNTNILNHFNPEKAQEKLKVDYEKNFSSYKYAPQPHVTGVVANVDLFPETPAADIRYVYRLKNKTAVEVGEVFLNVSRAIDRSVTWSVEFSVPVRLKSEDANIGVRIYTFDPPLKPGQEFNLEYRGHFEMPGFDNDGDPKKIVGNGTFFNNDDFGVTVGYQPGIEVSENKTRAKYGLAKRLRAPPIDNVKEREYNMFSRSSDWIDFEATVSTAPDQIAIAPGYLQRTWEENGRKYFHYKMDKPIQNFYSFLSGRYEVRRDKWNGVDIEVYHHPGHTYNIDRMVQASKDTLDYFTKNFGPYQFRQYRIIEFPRYASFAQSFPNTVPFSEAIGFVARVKPDDPKDVDFPYFVTAHELAHQWWGHQIVPAGVAGGPMPVESFAEYTALLVMEKKYGREKMKRFLKIELDRYLFGRQQEDEYETPLYLAEGQSYIHYSKGSLALFTLKEYLGEDTVNGAIKEYLEKTRYQSAPYTVTTEFIEILKRRTKPDLHGYIADALERITLFENRPLTAEAKKLPDGQYEVTLKVQSEKVHADGDGKETKVELKQPIDIGVTNAKGEFLFLKKLDLKTGENEIKVKVAEKPAKAGVDPLNYLIDKTPDDNELPVTVIQ